MHPRPLLRSVIQIGLGVVAWWEMDRRLAGFADWLTTSVFHLSVTTRLGSAVQFMVFETPKALVLLFGLFGWKVDFMYAGTGLGIAMIASWTIGRLKMECYIEPWVYEAQVETGAEQVSEIGWEERIGRGREAVREIVGKVWPYVIAGIAVGAGLHGDVPENFTAHLTGRSA